MKPDQDRQNDDADNFGYHLGDGQTVNNTNAPGIPAAKRKTVSIRPLCGILRQPKYLCSNNIEINAGNHLQLL